MKPSLLLVIRLVIFVELEALAGVIAVFFCPVRVHVLKSLFFPLDRGVEITGFGVGGGEGVEKGQVLPIRQFTGFFRRLQGFLTVADIVVGASGVQPCTFVAGVAVLGIEPDGLIEVGDGLVVLLLKGPGIATFFEGEGGIRVEPDRLVEVGDGFVVLLLGEPSRAPTVKGFRELGVEPDGFVEVGDGFVVFLL